MHRSTSKQRQLIRRIMVYALMVLVISGLVTALVLLMLGYRFDRDHNSVQQGGLVQFISRPNNAKIVIGKAKLASTTPTKITINPGQYSTTISKTGYRTWSKTVDVLAGHVLWLNYAQLVPNTITTKPVLNIGETDGVVPSVDGKKLAFFTKNQPFVLSETNIDTKSPKITKVALPKDLIPASVKVAPTIRYWSKDSDTMLASINSGKETQWLYIDTNSPDKSANISKTYDLKVKTARFDPRSNTQIIVHTSDGDIRTLDMQSRSLSAVLATEVRSFSFFEDKLLLYVYTNEAGKRVAGYLNLGETKGRDLPMAADDVELLTGGKYFDTSYITLASKQLMRLYRLDNLPNSNSTNAISSTLMFSTPITEAPIYASMHNNGRFVVLQSSSAFSVYDIELARYTATKLGTVQSGELRWLDGYHLYYSGKDTLNVVEFDGANGYQVGPANGWVGSLLNDGKYLYSTLKTDAGYSVQRSQMIID